MLKIRYEFLKIDIIISNDRQTDKSEMTNIPQLKYLKADFF